MMKRLPTGMQFCRDKQVPERKRLDYVFVSAKTKNMKAWIKLAGVAAVAGTAAVAAYTAKKANEIINRKYILPEGFTYTAHTGCEDTPENSLASLEKATALGVPVVEVDVTLRADGTPVLLHAPCAAENEGVLLTDALAYIKAHDDAVQVNLDLKAFANTGGIQGIVQQAGMLGRCFFTGVEEQNTQTVKIDAPDMPFYLNINPDRLRLNNAHYIMSIVYKARQSGAVGINCNFMHVSGKLVEVCRREGLKVSVWTVDNKPAMQYMLRLAPDNITTRYPVLFTSVLEGG